MQTGRLAYDADVLETDAIDTRRRSDYAPAVEFAAHLLCFARLHGLDSLIHAPRDVVGVREQNDDNLSVQYVDQ